MALSDLSIRRPVLAWMIMAALIIFGAVGFSRMGVSQLPNVDFPIITLHMAYPGAAPEVMETDIIDPIEETMMSIDGIKSISSNARNGIATIMIDFSLDKSVDSAMQDVQAKMNQIRGHLPVDAEPPIIMKVNPDEFPIMWVSVSNDVMSKPELMTYVRDEIKEKLSSVPGVGSIWTPGYLKPNLRIWVNPKSMDQYALSASDLLNTLKTEHLEPPGGRVEFNQKEFNLRTYGEAATSKEIEAIQITSRGGAPNFQPVRLGQVARVVEGTEDVMQFARSNGRNAVGLGIVKQRGANAVEVAKGVKKKLQEIQEISDENTFVQTNFDSTEFIEESIHELILTLVLAAILTSLVCWLFLGSLSSTLNVVLAIPTSVIGTFIILYFCGFSLNLFTLLGLSLAIGIVVDDAIMVLENIIRHREMGKSRVKAARDGAKQITFAALAATISVVAIFLPIALMKGIMGKFLYQFGVTLSAAVMLSLLEALTLTPMRASQFIDLSQRKTRLGRGFEALMSRLTRQYVVVISWALSHKWKLTLGSLVFFVISFAFVGALNKEFQPAQDQGSLMVRITAPPGSGISFTDKKIRVVEDFLKDQPSVDAFFAAGGGFGGGEVNHAITFVSMKRKGNRGVDSTLGREITQQELIERTRSFLLEKIPDVDPVVLDPSREGFSSSSGFPVEINIVGPDWTSLAKYSEEIISRMKKSELMTDVTSNYESGAPEIQILPDRKRAAEHGVSVAEIGKTVQAAIGGVIAGKYSKDGHRYDVRLKLDESEQPPLERVQKLSVRNNRGELVPLSSVVRVENEKSAAKITRKDRQRAIMITAGIAKGADQSKAIEQARTISKEVLPSGYQILESGSAEEMKESFMGLIFALVMGLLVSYMILGSQFNSFVDPITVFMALPFSFSGAFIALWIGGASLNIYSMIGLVLLMGLVKKNSILLVDFTNQELAEGKTVREALLSACPTRLRPILMTSVATIAAAIPPALSLGPGAETRAPMAIAVIGGVLVSTLLTLIVVPCVYLLLAKTKRTTILE